MSSGRGFQAALRCAGVLSRAAGGRSTGFAALNFASNALRHAGVGGAGAWATQASRTTQRMASLGGFAVQPLHGFAAQALTLNSSSSGTSCASTEATGGSSVQGASSSCSDPTATSGEDGESVPSNDDEGVKRNARIPNREAPPWSPQPTRSAPHAANPHRYSSSTPTTSCTGVALTPPATSCPRKPAASLQLRALSTSSGAHQQQQGSAIQPRGAEVTPPNAQHAGEEADGEGYGDAQAAREQAVPSQGSARHPSRPRHPSLAPHAAPAEQMRHLEYGEASDGAEGASEPVLSAAEYRARHHIRVVEGCGGEELLAGYEPLQRFEDAPFAPGILAELSSSRYPQPTPIQAQSWPAALAGRDVVAIASTGSGKTLGYLLPALQHIREHGSDPARGPTVLVLAPTRELAVQIDGEAQRFARAASEGEQAVGRRRGRHSRRGTDPADGSGLLRTACLYGGASKQGQGRQLSRRPQLVIATPGRLIDFVESGELRLGQVSYLVLDEADRMLDMGFELQVRRIASELPASRQTLLYSATWPKEVRQVAASFTTREPLHVFIGNVSSKPVAAATITQLVRVVQQADKMAALEDYLRGVLEKQRGQSGADGAAGAPRAMVFCSTKSACDMLAYKINTTLPFQAASLHGDKSQAARDYALQQFRRGQVRVLVATDVAARGLDISDVTAVVNYDMPTDMDMYIHRIGRTGRAGATGESMTFLTPQRDADRAAALVGVLLDAGQHVAPELEKLAEAGGRGGGGASGGRARGSGRGGHHQQSRWGGGGWGRREERWGRGDGEREVRGEGGRSREGGSHRHHADDWRGRQHGGHGGYGGRGGYGGHGGEGGSWGDRGRREAYGRNGE